MLGRRLGPHRILYEILQALHHASILRDSLENPSRTAFPKQLWMLDNWLCLACDPVPVKNGVHQEMHKLNLYYVECAAGLALRHYDIAIKIRIDELRNRKISPSDMNRALATATRWGNSNYRKRNSKFSKSPFHRANLAELEEIAAFNTWTGNSHKGFQTNKQPPKFKRAQPANNASTQQNSTESALPPANTSVTGNAPGGTQPGSSIQAVTATGGSVTPNTGNPVSQVTAPPAPVERATGPPAGTDPGAGTSTAAPTPETSAAGSAPSDTPQNKKRPFSRLSTSPGTTFGSFSKRVVHAARPSEKKRGVASANDSDSRPQQPKTKTFPPKKSFCVDLEGKRTVFNSLRNETSRGSAMTAFWHIPKVTKKIFMIGDQLLSIPTELDRDDVQIVSFPSLTLHKLYLLLTNFRFGAKSQDPGQIPTDVFISVGFENRGSASSTNNNDIAKVMRLLKSTFPGARIHLCKVPHSSNLPEGQEKVLKLLNDSFAKKCNNVDNVACVPLISSDLFETETNGTFSTNWSKNCANAMIRHYLSTLN